MAYTSYSGSYSSFDYGVASSAKGSLFARASGSFNYQIFEQCSQAIEDPAWKHLLLAMSRGDFQYGLGFDGNRVFVNNGKAKEYIELSDQYELATEQLKEFITNHTVFRGTEDQKRIEERQKMATVCTDGTLLDFMFEKSRKALLFTLLYRYVDSAYEEAGWRSRVRAFDPYDDVLTQSALDTYVTDDAKYLRHLIQTGEITKTDVTIEDQEIKEINGVFLSDTGFTLEKKRLRTRPQNTAVSNIAHAILTTQKKGKERKRSKPSKKPDPDLDSAVSPGSISPLSGSDFSHSYEINSY